MKNPISKIHIVTTGGTIEKSYDELDGTLENRTSIMRKQVIDRLRLPYRDIEFHAIMAKDSLHMNDDDRKIILDTVKDLMKHNEPILILHGTDTMTVSAEYLSKQIEKATVPVVFTGAMRPIGFDNSDALQNVTEALLATTLLAPGIYLSFHGRVFSVPGVTKDRENRTFCAV